MRMPLTIRIWSDLRNSVKSLSAEGKDAVSRFVLSQKRENGYCGAGGQVEPYYTQFGELLENALKGNFFPRMSPLVVSFGEDKKKDEKGVYSMFFHFLNQELKLQRPSIEQLQAELNPYRLIGGGYAHYTDRPEASTNATCASLAMLNQVGVADENSISWLMDRQDETGGFRMTEDAPVPDLLSTGVAMFTLRLCGRAPKYDVQDFVEFHWLENGGFAPTLLDEYSDVEYVFYGLLALGPR